MRQYTRRNVLKLLGVGAVTVAGLGLVGCGGSGEGAGGAASSASEPVPASQAFAQAGVWMQYDGDEQIGKDVEIERILSFDGNGNVAVYLCDGATFGGPERPFQRADNRARQGAGQGSVRGGEAGGYRKRRRGHQAWQQCYDTLKAEADAGTYDSMNNYGAYGIEGVPEEERAAAIEEFQIALENTKSSLDAANEGQAFNEAAEYQEPQPQPYTLALETDGSGNVAAGEEIRFLARRFSFYQIEVDDTTDLESPETRFRVLADYGWHNDAEIPESAFSAPEDSIGLYSSNYSTTQAVYDTTFGGYSGLATVMEERSTRASRGTRPTQRA